MNQTKYTLMVVVAPRAIGKTYWIERILAEHPDRLRRVKTTTTRLPRDDADRTAYNFVTEDEFSKRLAAGEFLEHDVYRGARYASSLRTIEDVLLASHGIMALTPVGAAAVWGLRNRYSVRIVRLVPSDDAMVIRNLDRRGITEEDQRRLLVAHAREFDLPSDVVVTQVVVTGDAAIDGPAVRAALAPPC